MNALSLTLTIVCAILLDTAWVALFRSRPVGKFEVLRDAGNTFGFTSNAGTFTAHQDSQTLTYVCGKLRGSLKFSEIKGLEYRVNEKYALLEELFFGLDLTDLLPRYHDTIEWFCITMVTLDGRRIPMYLSGQYQQREFLLGWYIELQAGLLARLGLLKDVEAQSRGALNQIQARMGGPRLL